MEYGNISSLVEALLNNYQDLESDDLKQNLILSYYQHILSHLNQAFNDNKDNIDNFLIKATDILAENWELVRGSLLCYTNLPTSDVTLCLCSIADFIAGHRKELDAANPLKFLMPTVQTESLFPAQYPHLCPNPPQMEMQDENITLARIIKTHILSTDGKYLIPVSILLKLNENSQLNNKGYPENLVNPYFDGLTYPEDCPYIQSEEFFRLIEHSPKARAFYDAKVAFDIACQDKRNLLGQMRELNRILYYSSVQVSGKEEKAGDSAYLAISNFFEYYNAIDSTAKNRIPRQVKKEIETLFHFAASKNNERNIGSCLATRRTGLLEAIQDQESILSEIGLNKNLQTERIEKAKYQLKAAREALELDPFGEDQLGLQFRLLQSLNLSFECLQEDDLVFFYKLQPQEIIQFLQDENIQGDVLEIINEIALWVIICHNLSPHRLEAFLSVVGDLLWEKLIKTAADLSHLISSLDNERCELIFKNTQRIIALIKTPTQFARLVEHLNDSQKNILFEILKLHLTMIIMSPHDLSVVFKQLNETQRQIIFELLKPSLPHLIKRAVDFSQMGFSLSTEQHRELFKIFHSQLPSLIKTAKDAYDIFKYLTSAEKKIIFEPQRQKLIALIHTPEDLSCLIHYLEPGDCLDLCLIFAKNPHFIPNTQTFLKTIQSLNSPQKDIFYEVYKYLLPQLIKNTKELKDILLPLNTMQREETFKICNQPQFCFIQSLHHFEQILPLLTPTQADEFFTAHQEKICSFIANSEELNMILKLLSARGCFDACQFFKKYRPHLLSNSKHLASLLYNLDESHSAAVYEVYKTEIAGLIRSNRDIQHILTHLHPAFYPQFCRDFDMMLSFYIQTSLDLLELVKCIAPVYCMDFTLAYPNRIRLLLQTSVDFLNLLDGGYTRCNTILRTLAITHPPFLSTPTDLIIIAGSLQEYQLIEICQLYQVHLEQLIKNKEELLTLLQPLSIGKSHQLCKFYIKHLVNYLKTEDDLKLFETELSAPKYAQALHFLEEGHFQQLNTLLEKLLSKDVLIYPLDTFPDNLKLALRNFAKNMKEEKANYQTHKNYLLFRETARDLLKELRALLSIQNVPYFFSQPFNEDLIYKHLALIERCIDDLHLSAIVVLPTANPQMAEINTM